MQSDWMILLPYIVLTGGGLIILCAGLCSRTNPRCFFATAAAAVLAAAFAAVLHTPAGSGFGGMIDSSGFARFFILLVCFIALATLFLASRYAGRKGIDGDEFYSVILFAALGMTLAAGALNWIIFFLGLELLSISFYILIGSARGDSRCGEAALKYFVMGSVASGFLVFGIALLFAATGTLDIARSLGQNAAGDGLTIRLLGLSLIAVGIGFKVSVVPFHLWTPDVYQGAPAPVTAFLSTGSKVALFAGLLRFSLAMSDDLFAYMVPVLWGLAAATMIVGNVTALAQTRLKRLLAYSSIAQMGYILMALPVVRQGDGAASVMFYLAAYAMMDLGAFGAVALLSPAEDDLDRVADYRGVGYSHPWTAALLSVCLLSLAGLPPTAGFIGKVILFKSVIQSGFAVLAVIGIITAIISVYYYLAVIVALFMRPAEAPSPAVQPGTWGTAVSVCLIACVVLFGVAPASLLSLIEKILYSLIV